MRAKFINEKFAEDSDPIFDMGIGITPEIIKNALHDIFKLDSKNIFIVNERRRKKKIHSICISYDDIEKAIRFFIDFFPAVYYDLSGKEIDKKRYGIELLEISNLYRFMDMKSVLIRPNYTDPKNSPWIFSVKIKDSFVKTFEKVMIMDLDYFN